MRDALATAEAALVVNPSATTIEHLVDSTPEATSTVRVLAEERLLKDAFEDYLIAGQAADLVTEGSIAFRTVENPPRGSFVVTDDRVVALVAAGEAVYGVVDGDESVVTGVNAAYEEDWEGADPYDIRAPGIERARETLATKIDSEVAEDFDGTLASMSTVRGDGSDVDAVTVSLLVAAKNRVLLYDVSQWGEEVGLASKATFSRTKSRLEEAGLVDTEKVPIDIGRPRLRLTLADSRLEDADPDELVTVASSALA
jgi:hypothetical protein